MNTSAVVAEAFANNSRYKTCEETAKENKF
jgi:hypothetical protein